MLGDINISVNQYKNNKIADDKDAKNNIKNRMGNSAKRYLKKYKM